MAAPTVYKSSDANAPTLDGQKGSLINVLTACLVDGYSSGGTRKDAAGWTIATGPTSNKIIYRNNATTGTGTYFRIQDDGRIASGTTNYHTTDRACNAALVGMSSYSDIDTPVVPFPRVIAGGDLHDNYAYGVTIRKAYSTTSPTYSKPWMVIADNRTCWLITTCLDTNTTTLPTTRSAGAYSNQTGIAVTGFGDINVFNTSCTICAKAFVLGGNLGSVDVNTGTSDVVHNNVGHVRPGAVDVYLNRSLETAGKGVKGYLKAQNAIIGGIACGGVCTPNPSVDTYSKYYDGVTGLDLNPLIVCEYTDDAVRTYRTTICNSTEIGFLPGIYGCLHSTASAATMRVGDEFSTVTVGGRSYLLCSQNNQTINAPHGSSLLAFDLGDWWA
jgi:hypothetical protein